MGKAIVAQVPQTTQLCALAVGSRGTRHGTGAAQDGRGRVHGFHGPGEALAAGGTAGIGGCHGYGVGTAGPVADGECAADLTRTGIDAYPVGQVGRAVGRRRAGRCGGLERDCRSFHVAAVAQNRRRHVPVEARVATVCAVGRRHRHGVDLRHCANWRSGVAQRKPLIDQAFHGLRHCAKVLDAQCGPYSFVVLAAERLSSQSRAALFLLEQIKQLPRFFLYLFLIVRLWAIRASLNALDEAGPALIGKTTNRFLDAVVLAHAP
jgi:hypothetical protein